MDLELDDERDFDFSEDEEEAQTLPDEVIPPELIEQAIAGGEINENDNFIIQELDKKTIEEIETKEIDNLIDDLEREFVPKDIDETKPNPEPETKPDPKVIRWEGLHLIKSFQPKPVYTWEKYEDFFPCASIEYLQKVYKENSFAGKVFEILMVEATKTLMKNIKGKITHWNTYRSNNIWIEMNDIYKRTYPNCKPKIIEAMRVIAYVLEGKLEYGFKTCCSGSPARNRNYIVLNIIDREGILNRADKDFVESFPKDYKLTNAELIFLRQVQCGLFKNNEQKFKNTTLLQFGEIAWRYFNNKKVENRMTLEFMETLQINKRMEFKKIEGDKYFVKEIKPL
jgi:hypothetical protein